MSAQIVPMDINTPEPGSLMEAALKYAALNWRIVPCWWIEQGVCACGKEDCKSPGKHPIGAIAPFGQNSATTDASTIRKWWLRYPKASVATYLAPSGLCAIDIDPRNGGYDTIDALEAKHGRLESDLLQFTGGGGEHRVFQAPAAGNLPGKLGPGVDVKQNGYIMLEPSGHLSGKRYEWEASSSPLDGCTASPLPDWVRDLAAPVMVGAGFDAVEQTRYPLSDDEIAQIGEAVQYIPNDGRDDWLAVGMSIHAAIGGQRGFSMWDGWSQSSTKYDPVDLTIVWRSFRLKGFAGKNKGTLFEMAMKHGWVNTGPVVDVVVMEPERVAELMVKFAPVQQPVKSEFNRKIPVPELQAAAEWMGGLYESPTAEISQAGALALASVVTGRMYRSTNANWTSMMMVVSGPSGVGKNYIKVGVERLLVQAGLDKLISGDFYTHQAAIYWALNRAPCHICISDEFGENFLEARKNNNSNKLTVFKALKKVYSDADHIFKPESYAMGGMSAKQRDENAMRPIINPALTLLGLTTPMQFFSEIKAAHIESGLINRFVIVNVENGNQIHGARTSDAPPQVILDTINRVRRVDDVLRHTAHDLGPAPVIVQISKEAHRMFDALKETQENACQALEGMGLDAMPRRWRENAMRMATALAPWRNSEHPVIDADIADFSIAYVTHWGNRAVEMLRQQTGENDYQQQLNKVLSFVRSCHEGASDTELSRKFREIKRREMVEIKNHLQEAELMVLQKGATSEKGGRPSSKWFAVVNGDE
jgi:hypothetical protein